MKNLTQFVTSLFAVGTLLPAGCSGNNFSNVPVSGKITSGGEPVAGIQVLFAPQPKDGNHEPGPWSGGLTNDQGEYSLVDRYGKDGTVVGDHVVGFTYADSSLEDLKEDLEAARGEYGSAKELEEAKKRLAEHKQKQVGRPKVTDNDEFPFTVPAGGTTEANFDLPTR